MTKSKPPMTTTLDEWRKSALAREDPRAMWVQFEASLLQKGYELWVTSSPLTVKPPLRGQKSPAPRTPDGFAYRTRYNDSSDSSDYRFGMGSPIHCPARTKDNRDVLIRLTSIGDDRGERLRKALARVACDGAGVHGDNHVLPVLGEVELQDKTFTIFPLMSEGFTQPWYYCFTEVLDGIEQVLEGINFCHGRLVAHLDLDADNILLNWVGGMCQNLEDGNKGLVSPFRQYLPVRYYICDFELAVTFDLDSDPASRVFTGFPGAGLRTGEYNREVAPEMRSGKPYCPFRADIFQLGYMFKTYFGHLGQFSQPLVDLFSNMCSDSPASRPSASVALERVRRIRAGLSNDVLSSSVPRYPLPPWYNSMLQPIPKAEV